MSAGKVEEEDHHHGHEALERRVVGGGAVRGKRAFYKYLDQD